MGNARALFVAHNDEDYAHVHIVASKINPDTGRAYDLAKSYRTLSKWALEYEREHGGIQLKGREDMNELRDAIAARDAGARARGDDQAAGDLHRRGARPRPAEGNLRQAGRQRRREAQRRAGAGAVRATRFSTTPKRCTLPSERGGPTIRYTTRSVLEAEAHVWRAGRRSGRIAQRTPSATSSATACSTPTGMRGSRREQARAFRHATGAEGLAIIDGLAGTGKSRTTTAVREAYEAAGHRVIGLAWTHRVVQDMQHKSGFEHASTVKRELFMLANGRSSGTAEPSSSSTRPRCSTPRTWR